MTAIMFDGIDLDELFESERAISDSTPESTPEFETTVETTEAPAETVQLLSSTLKSVLVAYSETPNSCDSYNFLK